MSIDINQYIREDGYAVREMSNADRAALTFASFFGEEPSEFGDATPISEETQRDIDIDNAIDEHNKRVADERIVGLTTDEVVAKYGLNSREYDACNRRYDAEIKADNDAYEAQITAVNIADAKQEAERGNATLLQWNALARAGLAGWKTAYFRGDDEPSGYFYLLSSGDVPVTKTPQDDGIDNWTEEDLATRLGL